MTAHQLIPGRSGADRERLLAIGSNEARYIVDNRKAIYTPVLAARAAGCIKVARDIPYGAHARHRLNVYRKPGAANAPVILFVHGGAFLRGAHAAACCSGEVVKAKQGIEAGSS